MERDGFCDYGGSSLEMQRREDMGEDPNFPAIQGWVPVSMEMV